ncbi:MAG: tRNA glutamyl-Q(34) synthetase GluQRS, partial [Psychromonas sp.]|nr:tRNA glutamyl-Q(34) synthetase GluQRS [Psychromonas sp.]
MLYIGRFAPSPSGALHFGSLVAAVGSYLQAKSQNGLWYVRIEDIDPPREVKGASQDILDTLLAYGLKWDGDVVYQSQQSASYEAVLNQLYENNCSYYCQCTRKIIKQQGGLYQGNCRNKKYSQENAALRINLKQLGDPIEHFFDQLHGKISTPINDDFILRRKDGLYAYNLAVVVDDIKQNVTEIVRGADLIETTTKQLALYRLLNKPAPRYLHLPLAVMSPGNKLSKQNHALAVDKADP